MQSCAKPICRSLFPSSCGSPPVVIQYAKNAANGITTTMPISCHPQRENGRHSCRGHCSNNPNMKRIAMPTMMARASTMTVSACEPMLSISPNIVDTMSTNRTRRQARIWARPRAFMGIAAVAMA